MEGCPPGSLGEVAQEGLWGAVMQKESLLQIKENCSGIFRVLVVNGQFSFCIETDNIICEENYVQIHVLSHFEKQYDFIGGSTESFFLSYDDIVGIAEGAYCPNKDFTTTV
ncbi:MAG TPA: hypothetical protein VI728_02110 [Syntrophales bacterium]|nr:hypothetical protein [Syntrophales bacterium]